MSGSNASVASTTAVQASTERLRITEIFHSIQGEADAIGWRTVFVRLTGCPLRCVWCDTEYSFYGGDWRAIDDIVAEVASHGARHVCVTGGEPLAQKRCLILLQTLVRCRLRGVAGNLRCAGCVDRSIRACAR